MYRRGFGLALASTLPALSGCADVLDGSPPEDGRDGARLVAADGDEGDWFGFSVAASGDTVVVGAPFADGSSGTERGSAYAFERSGGGWGRRTTLASGGIETFGFAVAVDADTAVVGAPQSTVRGAETTGSATVFTRTDGEWTEATTLVPDDARPGDEFGTSVAVDGDTVVVGADGVDAPDGDYAGAAYVFVRGEGSWREQARLVADDRAAEDQFGLSVALAGDTALVGSRFDTNANGKEAGSVYAFERTDGEWGRAAKLVAGDGDTGDWFGFSVAVEDGVAVVGAPHDEDPDGEYAGSAYVFERAGGAWSQRAKLVPNGGDAGDVFGRSVALVGDTAVVGAKWDEDPNGRDAGSAYAFEEVDGAWNQAAKLVPDDGDAGDGFGFTVAGDADTAVVGAPHDEDPHGNEGGAAYVFPQ